MWILHVAFSLDFLQMFDDFCDFSCLTKTNTSFLILTIQTSLRCRFKEDTLSFPQLLGQPHWESNIGNACVFDDFQACEP